MPTSSKGIQMGPFHVVVSQRTTKKCTKGTNACARPAERAEIIAFAYKRADS